MIRQLICIPSTANIPTHIFSKRSVLYYTYSREILHDNTVDYFDGHVVNEDPVCSRDTCLITDPYGGAYTEVCAYISIDGDRKIFYGVDGTRCLLCDVKKIVATTLKALQCEKIEDIEPDKLRELLEEQNNRNCIPDFYN